MCALRTKKTVDAYIYARNAVADTCDRDCFRHSHMHAPNFVHDNVHRVVLFVVHPRPDALDFDGGGNRDSQRQ